jgi:hypothetical protein
MNLSSHGPLYTDPWKTKCPRKHCGINGLLKVGALLANKMSKRCFVVSIFLLFTLPESISWRKKKGKLAVLIY